MILIDKKVFENRVYLYNNDGVYEQKLNEWYINRMLQKVESKYDNLQQSILKNTDKLNCDDKIYMVYNVIPFFQNENRSIDLGLISTLLSYDFIGDLTTLSEKPPIGINDVDWIKIIAYYSLAKFVFYDLENIKYSLLSRAKGENFNEEECIKAIESIYSEKVKEYNQTHIKLNIEPKTIKIDNTNLKRWNNIICENFIKNEIKKLTTKVSINLKNNGYFFENENRRVSEIKDIEKFNKMLKYIIDYNDLDYRDRHILLRTLNVQVCPYCNRQYITSYEPSEDKRANVDKISTADLDHFYPKSKFQLFSLSLYNFVPSCQICNSRMKLDKPIEILYPYNDFFDKDVRFEIIANDKNEQGKVLLDLLYGKNDTLQKDKYNIKINVSRINNSKRKRYIKGSIEMFQLEQIYQSHKDIAAEIIRTQAIYENEIYNTIINMLFNKDAPIKRNNKDRLKSVISQVDENSIEYFSRNEKNKILYGIDENEKNQDLKKPLGKFIRDILNL